MRERQIWSAARGCFQNVESDASCLGLAGSLDDAVGDGLGFEPRPLTYRYAEPSRGVSLAVLSRYHVELCEKRSIDEIAASRN